MAGTAIIHTREGGGSGDVEKGTSCQRVDEKQVLMHEFRAGFRVI